VDTLETDFDADPDDPTEEVGSLFRPENSSNMPLNWGLRDIIDDLGIVPAEDLANEQYIAANLAQRMTGFRAIDQARNLRKTLLKKVKCEECLDDLTGSEGSSVFNDVMAWEPRDLKLNVPSQRLVELVRDSAKYFDSECREFTHCPDIFKRVKYQVVKLLNVALLDAWPACGNHRSELSEHLASQLTQVLLKDFVKWTNESFKKKSK